MTVAIATSGQHLATEVNQKARAGGFTLTVVRPDAPALGDVLARAPATIVLLDATSTGDAWRYLAKAVRAEHPTARIVVLGGTADLQLVARAVLAGADQFLLQTSPWNEFANTFVSVAAGRKPTSETVFGRVAAALPSAAGIPNVFCDGAGRRIDAAQAIRRCDEFGLSVEEITDHLGVDRAEVEAITRRSRLAPTQGAGALQRFVLVGCVVAVFGFCYAIGQFFLSAESPRYRLHGTVIFNGIAVPRGTITFRSSRPGSAYSGYATILDGKFDTRVDGKGHVGGHHSIAIMGFDKFSGKEISEESSVVPLFEPVEWDEAFPNGTALLSVQLPLPTR